MTRQGWDFGYTPVSAWPPDDDGAGPDVVVALAGVCSASDISGALKHLPSGIVVRELICRPPIFWWRVESGVGLQRSEVADCLSKAGLQVRYVASARRSSSLVAPVLRYARDLRCVPERWPVRRGTPKPDPDSAGYWFLRSEAGLAVDRTHFGAGSGTRLAVIDDDAAGVADLDLQEEVLINLEVAPRFTLHGAAMVALAVGTGSSSTGEFQGVAPYASPRMYCIPKPDDDVVSLPLAIVRAANDGADVILCATNIEGLSSPMLDDALAFAVRFGRKGRGTAVVFPVGRETSSPENSLHASLSLSFWRSRQ